METVLLSSKSKPDLKLLIDLANKIGIKSTYLSIDEIEDIGLGNAIKKGRTCEFVDEKLFMKKLKHRIG